MSHIFDPSYIFKALPYIIKAVPVTLEMVLFAVIIGWTLGFIIAIINIRKIKVLNKICAFYVSFMRGTPMLVQLYLAYYGIPILLQIMGSYYGFSWNINNISPIVFAFVAFGLNGAAYNSETIRSSILSVDKNEIDAAKSIGMTEFQIMRRVILPEALVVAIPNLGNSLISLLKDTSIAFTISVMDIMGAAKVVGGRSLRYFEVFIAAAIVYWVICIILEPLLKRFENKLDVYQKTVVEDS